MPPRRGSARPSLPIIAAATALAVAAPVGADAAEMLRLAAQVPAVCVLRITDVAQTLDLRGGLDNAPIAVVAERCNDRHGYRVVLRSKNGGRLMGDGKALDYTVSFGPLSEERLTAPRAVTNTAPQTDWRSRALAVSIPPLPPGAEVALSDAVVLSIEAR